MCIKLPSNCSHTRNSLPINYFPWSPASGKTHIDQTNEKYSRPCCSEPLSYLAEMHHRATIKGHHLGHRLWPPSLITKQGSHISMPHLQSSMKTMPVSGFLFGWESCVASLALQILLSHWELMRVTARYQSTSGLLDAVIWVWVLIQKQTALWEE